LVGGRTPWRINMTTRSSRNPLGATVGAELACVEAAGAGAGAVSCGRVHAPAASAKAPASRAGSIGRVLSMVGFLVDHGQRQVAVASLAMDAEKDGDPEGPPPATVGTVN
jgi:hypothetical protein